jgi:amino acid adenylation domain-containing protein
VVTGINETRDQQVNGERMADRNSSYHGSEIAIIGMAGRFPKSRDVDELWQNLAAGRELTTELSDEELERAGMGAYLGQPRLVKVAGVVDGYDLFDASFFGFSPHEAKVTDPQHRLFLECAWEALELTGCDPGTYEGAVGVYAGMGPSRYLFNLFGTPEGRQLMQRVGDARLFLGNDKDYLPTWVSYMLNLRGPSVNVNTACSTSLVAVHLACQSLLNGECDIALAGGVTLDIQRRGYLYREGGILSPDGKCRSFDAAAAGTFASSGVGVVVLKPLTEALDQGYPVLAVIKGTAINNDGSAKVGFTAPSVEGQSRVIREALTVAEVEPDTVSYIEAHGTATEIGDPIEIKALTEAFRARTDRLGFCAIGSVKSNLGHADTAAGVAGLIKTVLALQHRQIPPSLHFQRPNPRIDLAATPFFVNDRLRPWEDGPTPRRAGVSSFGIGGTNAHVVLEEASPLEETGPARTVQLLVVSAKTATALETATDRLAGHLASLPEPSSADLADVAFTLQIGRRGFAHRRIAMVTEPGQAAAALRARDPLRVLTAATDLRHHPVTFLFPGQGAQRLGMGQSLYAAEPTFRGTVDRCADLLLPQLGCDLRAALFPGEEDPEAALLRLQATAVAQAALFVVELALARLWMEWGIHPEALVGHSIGEYTAACLAGVFSLEDGLKLVAARGRLMQSLPAGAMLSVHLDAAALEPLLDAELSLASVNGPRLCVASGPLAAIEALEGRLAEAGVRCRRLHTSHAFHSAMMDPILDAFAAEMSAVALQPPRIPFLSNRTGTWITAAEATDPAYWAGHLRSTVRFSEALTLLLEDPDRILLEVGPGRTLSTLALQAGGEARSRVILASLPEPQDGGTETADVLKTLGRLWLAGAQVDWNGFHSHELRRRVPLPTYPWERQRFWVDPAPVQEPVQDAQPAPEAEPVQAEAAAPLVPLERRPNLSTGYVPPATEVERRLARIWQDFLGVEGIGVHDNFFELGGHSLLLIEIVARIREELMVELPMRSAIEYPTVAELAAFVTRSIAEGKTQPVLDSLPSLVPDVEHASEPFPLTDVQEAYWIGRNSLFQLGNVATHDYSEVDLDALDVERVTRVLRRIIQRHSMMRAVLLPNGTQRILDEVPPYEPTLIDLRSLPAEEARARLQAIRDEMSHQVLPADRWPLFDLRIVRLADQHWRLHVSIDLLVVDAWSLHILAAEVRQLYAHPDSELPPIDLSFRDYVLTEVAFRDSATYRRALEYWRSRLATLPGPPDLPLARNPASLDAPRFVRLHGHLQRKLWRRLKQKSARTGLMPSGVLLAAYADVLTAWSKSSRFLLNLTLFNRLPFHPHVDRLVGDFTSLTLVEVDNSVPASFRERALRLQDRLWEDLEHRHVSGVRVLRELMQHRRGGMGTLAPVVFTSTLFMSSGDDAPDDAGDSQPPRRPTYGISQTPQVWLDLGVGEQEGHLLFSWDVVEELFPPGLLQEMFSAFAGLLTRLAEDDGAWDDCSVAFLPAEQLALRGAVNATEAPISEALLHGLFAARAAEQPDQPAVIAPGRTVTYGELQSLARRIGRRLRELGARPNQLVAVVMEKGWEQVAAVLGILEAGAAYLPLDPHQPGERLAALLGEGRVELALTQPWLPEIPEWPAGVRRLPLDGRWDEVSDSPLEPGQGPGDLAYVIFTSGSTGMPKGVMIDHRGAVNTILDVNQRFGVTANDRVLALSALSFDLSVYDVFGLLAAGGAVVLPESSALKEPADWTDKMLRYRVTLWNTVPALMGMLADFLSGRSGPLPAALRLVLMSGDWIPPALPDRIRALWPEAGLISLGGATEASIWSILFPIAAVDPSWVSIPYGKPMVNQTFQVLNDLLEPTPVWVPGQLYIGGVGLAKGYWGDEAKTATSFITHPRTGERLYRTGDLGRWLPDGNIEFLGREDFQVKVQGYRIELGEIESALAQHPAVHTAVVAALGEARGEKRLVAYIVPEGPPEAEPAADPAPEARHAELDLAITGALIVDPLRRIEFKTEQRGLRRGWTEPGIELAPAAPTGDLVRAYAERRSVRRFLPSAVPFGRLGELLRGVSEIELHGKPKYRYPSAGSLYPVQVYLYVKEGKVESLPAGSYYIHPKEHRLYPLAAGASIDGRVWGDENRPVYEQASFALFLIADHDAIDPLYGQRARDFCLLEAGYMGQLLMTVAPAAELGLCPIGGLDFEAVRPLFALTKSHELLHVLLGGAVDPVQIDAQPEESDDYEVFLKLIQEESGRRRLPARLPTQGPAPTAPAVQSDAELTDELRDFLRTKLPEYMVPSTFLVLASLPLTANGKVDRRALPGPETTEIPKVKGDLVPPRNALEAEVAALWCEVLGVESLGIWDDFFELGGHSLLAARLIARLRERFAVELPLSTLFETPHVAGAAAAISQRLTIETGQAPALQGLPTIVPDPARRYEPFPLTDLQQAYWFGGTSALELGNLPPQFYFAVEVRDLDVPRLEGALARVIERHDMLRAVLSEDGSEQRIQAAVPPYRIEVIDLIDKSLVERDAVLREVRATVIRRASRTDLWPLFDVRISRLDAQTSRLHVGVSLLACDAWSLSLFVSDLSRLYVDPAAEVPPLSLSFRDYVLAVAELEGTELYRRSLAYWVGRLPSLPPAPELPLARLPERGAHPGFTRRRGQLPIEEWHRFRRRAAEAGLMPGAVLCAVYCQVLARWSKKPRFTLNMLYFNRLPLHPEVDQVLANFSSTILLEVDARLEESFAEQARLLQDQLWKDVEHSQVSGVRLMRELSRIQGRAAGALAPVVFAGLGLDSYLRFGGRERMAASRQQQAAAPPAPNSLSRIVESQLHTPQVWLDHQVGEEADLLTFNWDSVDALFPAGLVETMFGAYSRLLSFLAAEDTDWREPIPTLLPAEQLAVRTEVNATAAPVPDGLLHFPLALRAAEHPERPAVLSARRTLSYGELQGRARGIGRWLRQAGAQPDRLVAIVMEKGWEQIVAAVAVLESGAAYLPVDPELPSERIEYLLRQGEVELVLTQPWIDERLRWPAGLRRLTVDDDPAWISSEPLATAQRPENLAYVLFTSGSTGHPKGVMIEHRAALNTIVDINRRFQVGESDAVLALSSLSFDLSVWDIFGVLGAGGALVLPEPSELREPAGWAAAVERYGVTLWDSVPALVVMLVDHLAGRGEALPPSLRLVMMSGDWIPVTLPDRLRSLAAEVEVMSLGGATEASIWSIFYPIGAVDPAWRSIPYGRPLLNQELHVLSEFLEPCPDWVTGPLYIGGIGLARGYWRDEEKTRASFITHPRTGQRLYRTGDLGRFLPDGNIEFLGREDLQVKVQGYRIELGEIESTLARHPAVRACVAAAVGERQGAKRLVAYVVPVPGQSPTEQELHGFLLEKLPAYMVPPSFVLLEELPLTANGKVDRGALETAMARPADREAVPPRDDLEREILALWGEVLEERPASVTDSFFELGGNSLVAVRLMARIQQQLGVDLPISTLFEGSTVADLAAMLRQTTGARERQLLVSIQPRGSKRPFFWIHPVGGDVLCYADLARLLDADRPFYGLQAPEPDGGYATGVRVEEMGARYLAEVRSIQAAGPYLLGGWSMGGVVAFEMAQQLRRLGEEVELLALLDTPLPGNGGGNGQILDEANLVSWFARDLGALAGKDLATSREELAGLDPDMQLGVVLAKARQAGILSAEVDLVHLRRHLSIFKANAQALHDYSVSPYPGRLLLLQASEPLHAASSEVARWESFATGGADVHTVPGNHYNILRSPHVEILAQRLRSLLGP